VPLKAAELPEAISVRDQHLVATVNAAGAQIYECKLGSQGKLEWQFREPVATLFADGKTVGRHYAGPRWEMADGSTASASVAARAPSTSPSDIPLLKLDVTASSRSGLLAGVNTIQRVNTKGGTADGPCESAGQFLSVPYEADYVFFRRTASVTSAPAPAVARPIQPSGYVASPVVVPPPAIGVIVVRSNDRDRKKKDHDGGPTPPPSKDPSTPPSKPRPPTAEPKAPPANPGTPGPVVRDHRKPKEQPEVRDHRAKPEVRDHRQSATTSNGKPGGSNGRPSGSTGRPASGSSSGGQSAGSKTGSTPCGFAGLPPCGVR
jgi:hypothetical protein